MRKAVTGLLLGSLLLAGGTVLAAEPESTAIEKDMVQKPVADVLPQASLTTKRKGTMVFIPLDTRPVCKDYTVATMQAAGWDIVIPPEELLSSSDRAGQPDELLEWLEKESAEAAAVVVSADALLYGGLVDSRTHHIDRTVLQSRVERMLSLKKKYNSPGVYVFVTIMRSPKASAAPVEPVYYEQWGAKLFRQGALRDKAELKGLSRKENKELQQLNKEIPRNVEADFYGRRRTNFRTTELLLHGIESGGFNYLLVGRDDTSPLSQAHKEARDMASLVYELPKSKIRFFSGADQLGLVLLTQAANRLTYNVPLVYTEFAPGKGGATVPTYEDDPVSISAREHIYASGAFPVRKAKNADFILAVNTPYDGKTLEASDAHNTGVADKYTKAFADTVETYLHNGKKVIVADSKYGNGADNALVKELFRRGIAYKVAAYGGWNTSGNSLGFALAQGMESPYFEGDAGKDFLQVRYLDDWAYQANARMDVYKNVIWPNYLPNSGFKPEQLAVAEKAVTESIVRTAEPVMGEAVREYDFKLPWNRMFEVQPVKKQSEKQ
ncbi:MAG: DUF4127 family protein [Acidaminococcaceae bacterium]|nr:DUF4127 family protein [Acidaminococcaceae bacterium]